MRIQMTNSTTLTDKSPTAQRPDGFPAQLRYCYYMRLSEAIHMKAQSSEPRVFKVPADVCWVVVPQELGYGWVVVLPLVGDEQAMVEVRNGLQGNLCRISPSCEDTNSRVLDIPERYPTKLLRDAERDHRKKPRGCELRIVAPAQNDHKVPCYGAAQLRYCYYLHLGEAKEAPESTNEQPVFNVPYKPRWVLIRKYLRDGMAQIYQLTSKDETKCGWEKSYHVNLIAKKENSGKKPEIVPKSDKDTWAQCILERYPEHLMRDAERDLKETKRFLDLETTRGFLKRIDEGSPEHWALAKAT